jgi:predicted MFS family arabinose efflux permease
MVVAVPSRMKGTSSSVFNSARFLGFALSPIMLAPLYVSAGFDFVMVACALMGVAGLLLAALPRHEREQG